MKTCEVCDIEVSVFARFCGPHADERRKERDRNRKRQQYQDGAAYAKVKEAQTRQREIKRQWVCDYLSNHPCVDCGEKDIIVLEFDHRGDEPKTADVITMVNGTYALKTVINEVQKCDVRCCNDHRRKTVERLGSTYRTKYVSISPLPPK